MPKRNVKLVNEAHYHVYNRATGSAPIFSGKRALGRFTGLIDYYRYPQILKFSKFLVLPKDEKLNYEKKFRSQNPIVELYSYSLLPNHYHLLLKQKTNDGIRTYVSNLQKSYAKYFNIKSERHGGVFQGPFKAKYIDKDNYLLHLSRYIHLNPVTSLLVDLYELDNYPWTSFPYYLNKNLDTINLVNTSFITKLIGSKESYKKFVYDQADYQKKLVKIKGLLLE